MPGTAARTFVQTKEPELKNGFDDWLARIVCFSFSVSPQALVSPMDRATAEVQEQVLASYMSRGILPLNEARLALGRAPLPDATADRAMALVATGYVGLDGGAAAAKLGKTGAWDESRYSRWPAGSTEGRGGRFAPADARQVSTGRLAMTRGCKKEWIAALEDCERLLSLHEFHPDRDLLRGHTTMGGCAMGFVSEACGGNAV